MKPFHRPLVVCAAALLLLPACQNVPKYKKSSGRFDEWKSYEGKGFRPASGIDTAIDTAAQTITITKDNKPQVYNVTPDTEIMHNGDNITLAELPLNQTVKYTLEADHRTLATVWYGNHSNASMGGTGSARRH